MIAGETFVHTYMQRAFVLDGKVQEADHDGEEGAYDV